MFCAARMRRALILKIEEKVAEVSGCPMHADETALVGALVGDVWCHTVRKNIANPGGYANLDLGKLHAECAQKLKNNSYHIFSIEKKDTLDF